MEDREGCELFFFDESGVSQRSNLPYCWSPIGESHCKQSYSQNKKINILGFLSLTGQLFFESTEDTVSTETVISAFDNFINHRESDLPCFILLDNASMHRSTLFKTKIKEWLMKGVLICYLPPYSPELNLIEILWRKLKYEWLTCDAFTSFEKLKKSVLEILTSYGNEFTITFS